MANVYVCIVVGEDNADEVLSIKKGDIVTVTVDYYDDHLEKSLYFYATEYEIYR